jgi:hypothetical protein
MNRKQAIKAGGRVLRDWKDGYKHMSSYANGRLTREDFAWLMSCDLRDLEAKRIADWPAPFFYGRIAAAKNILKKGAYKRDSKGS